MTSTAGIVGSASKGIGLLSGDAEYVRKRSLKNQQDRASRGGIMDGLMDGGENVVHGIASGVSGLVTKPYEEVMQLQFRAVYLVFTFRSYFLAFNYFILTSLHSFL